MTTLPWGADSRADPARDDDNSTEAPWLPSLFANFRQHTSETTDPSSPLLSMDQPPPSLPSARSVHVGTAPLWAQSIPVPGEAWMEPTTPADVPPVGAPFYPPWVSTTANDAELGLVDDILKERGRCGTASMDGVGTLSAVSEERDPLRDESRPPSPSREFPMDIKPGETVTAAKTPPCTGDEATAKGTAKTSRVVLPRGTSSVAMTLRRLQSEAIQGAEELYAAGPGRKEPPAQPDGKLESILRSPRPPGARKALKKRSAYTSRFRKVVYTDLLEAEVKARSERLAEVEAQRDELLQAKAELEAQVEAAIVNAAAVAAEAAVATSPITPAADASMESSAVDADATVAAEPATTRTLLTWPSLKDMADRWPEDFSDLPIFEATGVAANAA